MNSRLRTGAAGMLLLALAGCNSMTGDSIQTLRLAIQGQPSLITIDRVNAIQSPSILAALGQAEALMILAALNNGIAQWSGQTESLVIDHGRLVQSAGLPADMLLALKPDDPFRTGLHRIADGTQVTRLVDYPARYLTGLEQTARYQRGPVEPIEIMGQTLQLQRVDEHINTPDMNFKATNRYWVDPNSGFVHRSMQYLAPDLPPLRLTVLKTYGEQL